MSKQHKPSPGRPPVNGSANGQSTKSATHHQGANPPREPQPAVLVARGIVKELGQGAGKIVAVKGVDIELRPGELTLLMGPSGSGKTTLLSILGCILSATAGTVTIDGTVTSDLKPEALATLRRNHIGYIFQSYNLFPTLTALENVRIALDVAGIKGSEAIKRAEQSLRDVGLDHKFNSYPANLSGGEKQRVAVARAIASAPSIVLADEPTAALDSENGHGVMRLLADIARTQNRSILVVTHDPRTLAYADRVIKIEDGLIIAEESPNSRPAVQTGRNVIEAVMETPAEPVAKRRRKHVDERQVKPLQPEDLNELIRKRKSNA